MREKGTGVGREGRWGWDRQRNWQASAPRVPLREVFVIELVDSMARLGVPSARWKGRLENGGVLARVHLLEIHKAP